MSMSLLVILALECNTTTSKLNEYSDELGYSIHYEKDIVLNEHSGFLPVTISGEATGVESFSFPVKDLPDNFSSVVPEPLNKGQVNHIVGQNN
ncbi:MAG: hypothetical protein AB8D52_12970 [Gammaproteobacteria bacterium]